MAGSGSGRKGGSRGGGGTVEPQQPLTQKERWAKRAEQRRQQADRAEARAKALEGSMPTNDFAYWTQPGKLPGRARAIARLDKAQAERQKAERLRERASNLERMATTVKGTAAAKQQARRDAWDSKGYKVGDTVDSVLYGPRTILRINKKTVTLAGMGPKGFTEDKSRLR